MAVARPIPLPAPVTMTDVIDVEIAVRYFQDLVLPYHGFF